MILLGFLYVRKNVWNYPHMEAINDIMIIWIKTICNQTDEG
jgi:hypothetical protein